MDTREPIKLDADEIIAELRSDLSDVTFENIKLRTLVKKLQRDNHESVKDDGLAKDGGRQ